jgi:hypothetical protein
MEKTVGLGASAGRAGGALPSKTAVPAASAHGFAVESAASLAGNPRVGVAYEPFPDRPVLVVPDVHQDLDFLESAIARAIAEGAALAFLGDHVDAVDARWGGPSALRAGARRLTELAETHAAGCLFIAGNHDVQALDVGRLRATLLLAGDEAQVARIDAIMPQAPAYGGLLGVWGRGFLRDWRLSAVVHGFLLSHAGVARRLWPWEADLEGEVQAQQFLAETDLAWHTWLREGVSGPLFQAGPGRGGSEVPVGGPIWLDWDSEFVDDLPLPQLVGHTRAEAPRRKDRSWCLDAAQTHVGLLDPEAGLQILRL